MKELQHNHNHRTLWLILTLVVTCTFIVLGFFGREIYRKAPPIPDQVISTSGQIIFDSDEILSGQEVWENMGGQTIGSIWGHGAYQAPDWTADWLHKEATGLLENWSNTQYKKPFANLTLEQQTILKVRLKSELHQNNFDKDKKVLYISDDRATVVVKLTTYYDRLFGTDKHFNDLRAAYSFPSNIVDTQIRRKQLAAFVFWTSWASVTRRPGLNASYTQNWPPEPLVDNVPTPENIFWSIISLVVLLAGIGALVWYQAFRKESESCAVPPKADPIAALTATPSMKATLKYVVVVTLLFILQVLSGAVTAHYSVEGDGFFGLPLDKILPYALSRTWHVQLAMFWIATSFLALGLFLAPAVSGHEPKYQKLGVNLLFGALVIVVGGSLLGEALALNRLLPTDLIFLFGHQGFEYIELGRVWQTGLYIGLLLWLVLVLRALRPALSNTSEGKTIVWLFTCSAGAIGLFYGAGFMFGARTHLSVIEYWRWWVVHLWVEGFMEVFATAAVAFIFSRLGLIRATAAGRAVLLSTSIFLIGGIPGTFHHVYFSGTPSSIMAVGASFSALEVVPLVLIGFEAADTLSKERMAKWMRTYKWPIRFFVAVCFWNLVGAGLFGFLINPPIALFYMQGLNTTPVHGHTALFGVYGFLALGMCLLILMKLRPQPIRNESLMSVGFWAMNIGLLLMVVLSLLPVGLLQTIESIETGLWSARSAAFMHRPHIVILKWLRMVGDIIFMIGAFAFASVIFLSLVSNATRAESEPEGQLSKS